MLDTELVINRVICLELRSEFTSGFNKLNEGSRAQIRKAYENDDLPAILGQFRVGLLPYRVGHPMTDHVNPEKLHHS